MNKIKLVIVATLALTIMTSCDNEKNKLDNRVIDFWNYKINKEFDKAYEFLSPGWKSNEDKESYIRRMSQSAVEWLSVEIKEKKCTEPYLCTVKSKIKYEYQFRGVLNDKIQVPSVIKEKWLLKDNVWYQVPATSTFTKK